MQDAGALFRQKISVRSTVYPVASGLTAVATATGGLGLWSTTQIFHDGNVLINYTQRAQNIFCTCFRANATKAVVQGFFYFALSSFGKGSS
jgi:hypothetical protein